MADLTSKIDRTAFTITTFAGAEEQDRTYWHSVTPEERLAALEQMRQINYAYDPTAQRLQRVLEVAERA